MTADSKASDSKPRRSLTGAARWLTALVVSWLVLRPSLLVTISLDDFINPFYVYDKYGSNPVHLVTRTTSDVFRNGHFNVIGQVFGSFVFAGWNYLLSWGVRYSLVYAATKFVVLVFCSVAAARLLRTLAALLDRSLSVWRARVVVGLGLFTSLQLHVPFSLDPVGSFPLYGYLPAGLGCLALDAAVRALQRDDRRSAIVAAAALCGAILYYEINVAIVVALVPIVVMLVLRARRSHTAVRALLGRAAFIAGVPAAMSLVLVVVAGRTNKGYTGTDVEVGGTSPGLVVRTVAGSLPAAAWRASHDWLGTPFGLTAVTLLSAVVVGAAVVAAVVFGWMRSPQSAVTAPGEPGSAEPPRWRAVVLVTAAPVVVWVAATLIQTVTAKVGNDTVRLGYVYNYYAYGSVGVVLAAVILVPLIPHGIGWRRVRPVLLAAGLLFVVTQMVVNDSLQRAFAVRLVANSNVLLAYSERPPEAERCAALEAWAALPYWLPYYRAALIDGMNVSYQDHFGELFCSTPIPRG